MGMATTQEQLADLEAIKQLKARYFRLMDTKQWAAMREVFTEDVKIEGGRPYDSLDDFMDARSTLDPAITTHHGHMPEIVFLSPTLARGIWAMYDRVEYPEPFGGTDYRGLDPREHSIRGFMGTGHYEEEYRKDDGVWRISRLKLTRLRLVAIVGDPAPAFEITNPSHGTDWLTATD